MRNYSNKITLTNNIRGVYSLDPFMGCKYGLENNKNGCYDDCYAARYARKFGYNFENSQRREFESEKHLKSIIKKINSNDSIEFIRMGTSCDPSESWSHTINIIESLKIEGLNKKIVIITKHFTELKNDELRRLKNCDIIVNTSISALDFLVDKELISYRLKQYNKLKKYCKSILRVVTADFKKESYDGEFLNNIQNELLENKNMLETVLRVSPKNKYVISGLINIEKGLFLGKKCNFSQRDKNTHIDSCSTCLDKCGILIKGTKK